MHAVVDHLHSFVDPLPITALGLPYTYTPKVLCKVTFLTFTTAGLTSLLICGRRVLLTSALEVAEAELMGRYASCWPLTKVLDIGGTERSPKYTATVDQNPGACCLLV